MNSAQMLGPINMRDITITSNNGKLIRRPTAQSLQIPYIDEIGSTKNRVSDEHG